MFFRIKPSGTRRYLQIVENTRDGAATRQRVLATLGRVEDLEAAGKLDALLRSGARLSETALLISSLQAGTLDASTTARIGAPMRAVVEASRVPACRLAISSAVSDNRAPERSRASSLPAASRSSTRPR